MWKSLSFLFTFSNFASILSSWSISTKALVTYKKQEALKDRYTRAADEEDLLVVSPYTSRPHLLDLTTLTRSQVYLAKALTIFSPVTNAYATATYTKAFNWDIVFSSLAAAVKTDGFDWTEQVFYIVVFRSQVPPSTDRSHLAELDERAHVEAMRSGGLLKYWFGTPDANGRNLATCIWRRHEDAVLGGSGEGHKAAMRATINMYSEWHVERFKLVIGGNLGHLDITPWRD
ncbi:MAG: hypothetical protein LQ338_002232 [Usnochroma carphineum]|nr:MAG: hypothetical protein LQ338_002232 [Usnochroma carphineum]